MAYAIFPRALLTWFFFLASPCALIGVADAQVCLNSIACENLLPGDTGWEVRGAGNPSIQGFATDISVNAGETVFFKINTSAAMYRLDIYRLGYYGGSGARKVAAIVPSAPLPQVQPPCLTDSQTKLVDCGNWAVSAAWEVPSTAISGIYIAVLVQPDTEEASHIVFVVRNDASKSDILFKTSDETWQAYNHFGGSSFEGGDGTRDLSERAFKISYNRPFYTRLERRPWLFSAEYAMVRWLEANGYDVTYFTDVDAARNDNLIRNHKVLVSVGYDEYMSGLQRSNLESARDSGVHLAFFTGSTAFWKTKWENSIDGTATPFRTLVCYKETLNGGVPNPADPLTWTGTWRDPRFNPPGDGGYPENALAGFLFMANDSDTAAAIEVPSADGRMRFWRNTPLATLPAGQTATLPAGTLGFKWDADIENGSRPAGLVPLSTTTRKLAQGLLRDYGASYGAGTATHRMGLYRARSRALVFGAGTALWAWGLDANHDGDGFAPDVSMQQATVNLLADMDSQPATIQSPLTRATKSSDAIAPTSAITSPLTVQYGTKTTLTGTATDTEGGTIGVVEVSVDGGKTWRRATGRENWTYEWTPSSTSGSEPVMVRAADDSANLQLTPTTVTFTVAGGPTIWSNLTAPDIAQHNDTSPVEVGMKFRSDAPGYITAIRFFKGPNNTGPHIGNLWTSDGKLLASVTFTDETASGWQQALFPSPVPIAAHTTYIASYYAPQGRYAATQNFFKTGVDRGPLHALADGIDGPNGVFIYAAGGGFPNQTFNATNYWVDAVFSPISGPSVWLIWAASTTPSVRGYNIYRAALINGPYGKLNTVLATDTSFVDADVVSGQTYFYAVTAVDNANESTFSNTATADVPP